MPTNIRIGINYGCQVSQPLNLSALFLTAAVSVRNIYGVRNLATVVVMDSISSKSQKHKRGCGRIAVYNAKFAAHQFGYIDSICPHVSAFMVSGDNAETLVCNRFEQFRTGSQLFHRGKSRTICIANAGCYRAIHQIAVKDAENILCIPNVRNILHNLPVVRLRVSPMIICHGNDVYVCEVLG